MSMGKYLMIRKPRKASKHLGIRRCTAAVILLKVYGIEGVSITLHVYRREGAGGGGDVHKTLPRPPGVGAGRGAPPPS